MYADVASAPAALEAARALDAYSCLDDSEAFAERCYLSLHAMLLARYPHMDVHSQRKMAPRVERSISESACTPGAQYIRASGSWTHLGGVFRDYQIILGVASIPNHR